MIMLVKAEFYDSFLKIFKGAFISQVLGLLISPILARLYQPEAFAEFVLYNQIIAIFLIFSGSSLLLLLPKFKDDKSAIIVIHLIFLLSTIFFVFLILFDFIFESILRVNSFFLAIGLLVSVLYGCAHYLSVSRKIFVENSSSKIKERFFGSFFNLFFGYFSLNHGMVYGNILGQSIFIYNLKSLFKRKFFCFFEMREYLNFIKRNFRHFVIQSSSQLIEFVLTVSFSLILVSSSSVQELGYFALVFRILNAPGMIISDYVSQLSLNRVSDFESNHHKLIFLIKIFFLLVGLSILLSLVLQFLGGDIFTLLFGEKWARSGEIVSYYVWGITATFTIRSLQYLPNSIDRQEIYTVVSFLSYGLPVLFIYYYVDWGWSLFEALTVLSVCLQLLSFSYFMILVYLFNKPE